MDENFVMGVTVECVYLILMMSLPMLGAALIVGLAVSILQAVTQVQEQTLSFVPKIVATFVALLVASGWIASSIGGYAVRIFTSISQLGPR